MKIQRKLTWLLLFSIIIWVFYPSEAYASRSAQGSNTHSFSVEDNPYKYSSYYSDSESGMYYLKARYYSSELMRFISRDTYDLSNRYAYCDGNPIANIDPSGHDSEEWNWKDLYAFIPFYNVSLCFTDCNVCSERWWAFFITTTVVDVGTVVALKYASEKLFDWMIGPSPARKYGIKFGKKIKPPKTDTSIKTLSIVDEVKEVEEADQAVEGIWEGNNKSINTLSKVEEEKTVEGNKNVSFCQSLCLFEDYTPDFGTARTITREKILDRNLNYYNAMLKK